MAQPSVPTAKSLKKTNPTKKKKLWWCNLNYSIPTQNKLAEKYLVQKSYGERSHSKNIQADIFYGKGSDIKKSAKKIENEKTDVNSMMAKGETPKSLTEMTHI